MKVLVVDDAVGVQWIGEQLEPRGFEVVPAGRAQGVDLLAPEGADALIAGALLVYCFTHSGTLEAVPFASWLGARRQCGGPHTTTSNNARACKVPFISFDMGEAVH